MSSSPAVCLVASEPGSSVLICFIRFLSFPIGLLVGACSSFIFFFFLLLQSLLFYSPRSSLFLRSSLTLSFFVFPSPNCVCFELIFFSCPLLFFAFPSLISFCRALLSPACLYFSLVSFLFPASFFFFLLFYFVRPFVLYSFL